VQVPKLLREVAVGRQSPVVRLDNCAIAIEDQFDVVHPRCQTVEPAQQLLARYRAGMTTQEQYLSELDSLRNPQAALPYTLPSSAARSPESSPDLRSPATADTDGSAGANR